ncbi:MAG: four helix bundle suffix domain-containing protein [Bacteroidota bacterium]|nr:four helix bundle suffix domain-containing protein [Bacteroidota bacterium]
MAEIVYDATVKFCARFIDKRSRTAFGLPGFFKAARVAIIHQTNYLLDQQLRQLEQQFLKEGGFSEKLYNARQNARKKS